MHETLGRDGWPGIEALPSRTLRKAWVQVQLLQREQPSQLLAALAERLHLSQVAAELGEERAARPAAPPAPVVVPEADSQVEVSEANPEEFDATERSWVGTRPQAQPGNTP